ncbi:CatB-related O-acetyltransferase [Poritiphilus flavus]|uniref:Antibiotic acetyltransferase n=1 Tax=Poritiphilus flavus TaxID=2697053 RepID=A0A6L9EA34_9FLAO|nr:CatB-related O-acetyltransferase [Poritiphilus flavus]NAS11523.1 antibiotic acetyltransferase [Poritiphilus flavus]
MKPYKLLSYKRNSRIAKSAKVYPFTRITNSEIGDFSYISYSCTINGCSIGKFCSIASGVKIGLGKHPTNFVSTSPFFYAPHNPLNRSVAEELKFEESAPVKIGNDVWIGANVVVLDGIEIGNGAIIGANSIVTKNVSPYSIVGGVPAKEIKKRFSEQLVNELNSLNWWDLPTTFFEKQEVKGIFSGELDASGIEKLSALVKAYRQEDKKV